MAGIKLDYNFKGYPRSAEVTIIDDFYWLFNVRVNRNHRFTLQFDFFTDTWKHESTSFVDSELVQSIGNELMGIYGNGIQSHRSNYLFSSPEYFTCRINNQDVIGFWGKKLRIMVSQTSTVAPNTKETEVHYYGSINNINFFFETENYNGEQRGSILRAIRWYAIYISHPLMKIKSNFHH